MKVVILFTLLVSLTLCGRWAVLVAGSNSYYNYRHQADVFHSYQSLIANGFDPENIIVMAYDDIANSTSNPFKGKVFNKPTYNSAGVDVYAGVKIDYSKGDVTPQNFMNVLLGDKQAAKGKKVLQAGPNDNVFIFFSDHGAVGLIAFPTTYMYADQLLQTFQKMKGKYGKIVFYLETCESGSMFQKLVNNTGIYALSAASPSESSWGTYCSPDDVVGGKHVGSCLGDLFSVNFIEDLDKGNYATQTLSQQFQIVKRLTTLSKVMQWGDLSFQSDRVGDYISGSTPRSFNLRLANFIGNFGAKKVEGAKMNSRTMKLQSLSAIYARDHSQAVFKEMVEEIASMKKYDAVFTHLSEKLSLDGQFNEKEINFECLRPAVQLYESKCGKFSDYGLMYVRNLAQACDEHDLETIASTLRC